MTDRAPIDFLLCGSDAKIRHEDGGAGMRHAYVECRRCFCRGPLVRFSSDPTNRPHVDAERAGVAGWNTLHARRTNQPTEEHEPCCPP